MSTNVMLATTDINNADAIVARLESASPRKYMIKTFGWTVEVPGFYPPRERSAVLDFEFESIDSVEAALAEALRLYADARAALSLAPDDGVTKWR